jgi:hypothetical protein
MVAMPKQVHIRVHLHRTTDGCQRHSFLTPHASFVFASMRSIKPALCSHGYRVVPAYTAFPDQGHDM